MSEDDKVRENRVRRALQRRGLRLQKSRRRDPRALDYGRYQILDPKMNACIGAYAASGGTTLDGVEAWLAQ